MFLRCITTALALLISVPSQAQSQAPCAERKNMLDALVRNLGEDIVTRGIVSQADTTPIAIFELLVNPATRTWSVILTTPENISCLVGSGTNIEFLSGPDCHRLSKEVKSNFGYRSGSLDQTSYRQICAQGSSHMDTAKARSGRPPLPR